MSTIDPSSGRGSIQPYLPFTCVIYDLISTYHDVWETPVTEESTARPLPLTDVRIVAVEQYGAGPFGSLHLAEMGADVIKIEDPTVGGDIGRYVPPYQEGEDSLFFQALNRNKRSLSLDLRTKGAVEVLHDLVSVSDAVYSNLKGDSAERLGLRYADLRYVNPRIVCCSLSGFGATGPRRAEPAYDYMIQALSGWMSLTGEPEQPPVKTGPSLVDFTGGYVAALSLMIGIHAARRDGKGMDCDIALFDVALSMLPYHATWHLTAGYEPTRTRNSAHPSIVPFQNFRTSDGWITVCCPKQNFWTSFCEGMRRQDLARDSRFGNFEGRHKHRDELIAEISAELETASTDHWIEVLGSLGVPVARVNTVAEALDDPQVASRKTVIQTQHQHLGHVKHLRSPVRVGEATIAQQVAPERGQDSTEILEGLLGYSEERRATLYSAGAFGADPRPVA